MIYNRTTLLYFWSSCLTRRWIRLSYECDHNGQYISLPPFLWRFWTSLFFSACCSYKYACLGVKSMQTVYWCDQIPAVIRQCMVFDQENHHLRDFYSKLNLRFGIVKDTHATWSKWIPLFGSTVDYWRRLNQIVHCSETLTATSTKWDRARGLNFSFFLLRALENSRI
jgi:hypothetical protein